MIIPESFLKSEVRDGFYVSAKMKRGWAAILAVLNEIDIVCKRHDIKWWADWGSLIAVVRHNGFIPWDDDFDISMLRKDYEKFLKFAPKELPKGYFFYNIYTDSTYKGYISRVSNGKKMSMDEQFLKDNHGCPFMSGVDIMCIDYLEPDREKRAKIRNYVSKFVSMADSMDDQVSFKNINDEYRRNIYELCSSCGMRLNEHEPLMNQLYKAADRIMSSTDCREAEEATCASMYYVRENFNAVFHKKYYEEMIMLPYEYITVPVPVCYDEILKRIFGNYMKPLRDGGTHDYPFYCRQEELIKNETGMVPWKTYSYTKDVNVMSEMQSGCNKKKDILFLIRDPKNWVFFEKFYIKESENIDNNIYIIPIPYYYWTDTMLLSDKVQYDISGFPDSISLTGFDKYDFFGNNPDMVYFDTPYDQYDAYICVHSLFFAENIRKFAKKMIYVSCIMVDEYGEDDFKANEMMKFCINTPGVALADEVIVQSERIRQRYIASLTEWAGEETRKKWEGIIKTGGLDTEAYNPYPPVSDEELTAEWIEVLYGH